MKKENFTIIILFLKIYLIALCIFTFFRLILFSLGINNIANSNLSDVIGAFVMGFRFDIVISSYLLSIPFIILSILSFFKNDLAFIKKTVYYFILVCFSLCFLVCAADIPFFMQFSTRFSTVAFEWMDTPKFVFLMIIQDLKNWFFFILFLISSIVFYLIIKKIFYGKLSIYSKYYSISKILLTLLAAGFIFIGIRGRLEKKSPIRVGTAFFCNNAFLNNLGLNPNFTFIRSYLDDKEVDNKAITLMDNKTALYNVEKYLNIKGNSLNPLTREITTKGKIKRHNVVIVLMERMTAERMKRHGCNDNLTPFLDSLSNEGLYFENFYTAGIHTRYGIFSTLFSFPPIFRQDPMKESGMKSFPGIASTLKNNGYNTIFFTTHDGQFDNVEGFLKANKFDKIIEKKNYPAEKSKTALGVPDDYMFEFSIPLLNKLNESGSEFLSVFLTSSNHTPYYIPDYFTPHSTTSETQVVEFADYSLRKFMNMAKKQKWFDNTIFVFLADHGIAIYYYYDIPLEYLHSPLLFYAPKIIEEKRTYSKMASQIDVYPTIMHILNIPYVNHSMGIDLLNEERPYSFFCADNDLGVIDKQWFLIIKKDQSKKLLKYRNGDQNNYSAQYPSKIDSMETYAKSHLQTFQYLQSSVYTFRENTIR